MAKAKDAFRTISEVAEWLDTPTHVLRFWESKFSQIKPVKGAGGRRYYRPSDMDLLGGIKQLLHEDGMTIKGTQKLLREKGVKHVAGLGLSMTEAVEVTAPRPAADATVARPAPTPPAAPPEPVQDVLPFTPRAVPVRPAINIDLPAPPPAAPDLPGRLIGRTPVETDAIAEKHAEIAPLVARLAAIKAKMQG
ncbi:MAG: MerR family transcriptional regulator [Pseudomonadota bacterium]